MTLLGPVSLLVCVALSSALDILTWPPLNCSQQGLRCTVNTGNCMDGGWLKGNKYTPSSPQDLEVSVDTRHDENGNLHPVLLATWKIRDDGSINSLKATELHILVMSTNQNLCVRYCFKDKLPMRSPSGEKWTFSTNMLVLDPGQRYRASVFNIPKPEMGHSMYDVSADVIVPDCQDLKMQKTQFCIERGSLWRSNISLAPMTAINGRSALVVTFSPDRLCREYVVLASGCSTHHHERIYKTSQETLNVTFSLDKWPRSCCQFDAEIKPIFSKCGQDCARHRRTLDICPAKPTEAPKVPQYTFAVLGVLLMCVVIAVVMYVLCRKTGKPDVAQATFEGQKKLQLKQPPKVLVIYSQDHYLYTDIVRKLCAFLQDKCGTKVVVDLLDSTMVGMVGRFRWLEWQRQQFTHPSDKILVLCSRGVQAKWKAMCGQSRVMLKEDIRSPTDDMLTPFLNLFLSDMHQAGMLGKYMVAYFDDISSEQDVPSIFDIAVKYKLMKHFEELYFRILDMEKYEPGQVNHIIDISGNEYFNCSSGRALKNSIEKFQAFQVQTPDWFENECVDNEEEAMPVSHLPHDQPWSPPVLECVPLIRNGLPVHIHEVEIKENSNMLHVLTPELSTDTRLSVAEHVPVVDPKYEHLSNVLPDHLYPHSLSPESVHIIDTVFSKPQSPRFSLEEKPFLSNKDEEDDSLLPRIHLPAHVDQRSLLLQNIADSYAPESSHVSMQSEYLPLSEINYPQPVEMDLCDVREPSEKSQCSGSDQGYNSKMSSQHEPYLKEDPLVALRRLQEEQFQEHLRYSVMSPEGN